MERLGYDDIFSYNIVITDDYGNTIDLSESDIEITIYSSKTLEIFYLKCNSEKLKFGHIEVESVDILSGFMFGVYLLTTKIDRRIIDERKFEVGNTY